LRGAPADLPFRWDLRTLQCGANFFLVTGATYVDLLQTVPGVDSFQTLAQHSQEMELFGIPVRVASLDDLIAMRRAAGRPKDQIYLKELEKLRARAAKLARARQEGE
jgi:predicted nucleotidyltransferase